jgi:DNA-binding NarL/FixJ family response regulator
MMPNSQSEPGETISVAVVEDNPSLRESLEVLLNGTPGFRSAGSFGSAEEALRDLPALRPAVVLMDIHLPKMNGLDCVLQLRDLLPESRIIMLTVFADPDHIFQALKSGANGYLSKRTSPADILKGIAEVHNGGAPLSSEIAVRMVQFFQQQGPSRPESKLTAREQAILEFLAQGYLYKEIAGKLGLSYETVHFHIRNIYNKLQVRSRTQAVAKFFGH